MSKKLKTKKKYVKKAEVINDVDWNMIASEDFLKKEIWYIDSVNNLNHKLVGFDENEDAVLFALEAYKERINPTDKIEIRYIDGSVISTLDFNDE